MDYKDLKSLLSSLGFILFYVFATAGIVKLLWNTKDDYQYEGRVKFLLLFHILFAFIYLVSIYHIVGPRNTAPFYSAYAWGQLIYTIVGVVSYFILKRK